MLRDLIRSKGDQVVSVCLPAHNEAPTVGGMVRTLRRHLIEDVGLINEILVIDDHSSDGTADVAAEAGARVVAPHEVFPAIAGGRGKGEALWRSLHAAMGDLIVWCDADITNFGPRFVVGLLGPLLLRPEIAFVKGFYERPQADSDRAGGGRVTELMARPLLAALFPHLASIRQPLSGEYAGRRSLLERLPFVRGYGVDLGLLIDVTRVAGPEAIAECDLGTRRHRNRNLDELGPQALTVLQTALARSGISAVEAATLCRPNREPISQAFGEIPALASLAAVTADA